MNRVDVGIMRQKGYAGSGLGAPWFNTSDGVPVGWTHTFSAPDRSACPRGQSATGAWPRTGPR
ncbi:hypothetical protein [Streptomyces sp. KL116D]|uniref:hypothetical protein n=1 Tax=Streptomyces sp. KL116D TaxID=3045152 RepID=UPI003558A6FF